MGTIGLKELEARLERVAGGRPFSVDRVYRVVNGELMGISARIARPYAPSEYVAFNAHGEPISPAELEERRASRHRKRWGALTDAVADRVSSEGPHAKIAVLMWFDGEAWDREEMNVAAGPSSGSIEMHRRPDVMLAELTPVVLERLAALPWMKKIQLAVGAEARGTTAAVSGGRRRPSSTLTTHSDDAFNDRGVYGSGIKVGVVEAKHEAILDTDPAEPNPPDGYLSGSAVESGRNTRPSVLPDRIP